MKTFYKYAAFAAAALAGLCACSSDDDAAETGSGLQPVAQPQIIVSDLTTTGFTLRWEAVDDAGSYVYTFDGGSETSTTGCRLEFNSLERQKEYVVAVKACPRDPAEYTESPFTYIHVLTDDLEQLPQPKITLGSAYASKTVISWTEVPEAELYEFSVDGGEVSTTRNRTVILSKLDKGRTYSFSVRHDVRRHALHQLGSRTALVRHLGRRRSAAGHRPDDDHLRRRGVRHLRLQRRNLLL